MLLSDGRLGACRVLRIGSDFGSPAALVAASPWIGSEAPGLACREIRKTLTLNHHKWNERREVVWVSEPPPAAFKELGKIKLSKKDLKATSGTFAGWDSLPFQVLAQWRWDNDREAVLAEDIEMERKEAHEQNRRARERQQYLSKVTLDDLARKDLFPQWSDRPPPAARNDTTRVMRAFIQNLKRERRLASGRARVHLEACVRELNRLDQLHRGFIETVEREDLYEVFEEILAAAKLPELLGSIDEWRDW